MTPVGYWVRLSAFVAPLLLALLWLAFRGDIPYTLPKLMAYGWIGLGAGVWVRERIL